ncbi:MAG: IS1182 family transposase [Kiritimatiellae bacterium]|nr:IS1182 family transposase [Kiritimatiellia bacterium]
MSEQEGQGMLLDVPASPAPEGTPEARGSARFRTIDRCQMQFRTLDVDRLVEPDHVVRAIWELSGRLDWSLYVESVKAVDGCAGRPAWDPRLLACIWVYAYTRGIGSARAIARQMEFDPAFQWLAGLETVNYHTLADFRTRRRDVEELFVQLLGVLSAEGLVVLQRITHDGTKIRACASSGSFRREKRIREHLSAARAQVEAMGDPLADETRERAARRAAAKQRARRLEAAAELLSGLQAGSSAGQPEPRVSETDPDARIMKQGDGGYAPSYNVQLSEDAQHGIVVGVGVSQSCNDYGELVPAVGRVEAATGRTPAEVVADGGFTNRENVLAMEQKGVKFFGNLPDHAGQAEGQLRRNGISEAFYPQAFAYDASADVYRCPAGRTLAHDGREYRQGVTRHSYRASFEHCRACPHRPQCCPGNASHGRRITRMVEDPRVAAFREKMRGADAKRIYRTRSALAEFPNAWIKSKIGLRQFHVRGLLKATAEAFWAALTFNVQQWFRLRWHPGLMAVPVA